MVYLVDDVDDNYSRLSKRRRPIQVYDCNFVNVYTTVMLSNFINNDDNLIIQPTTGEAETQNILFENISKFMQAAKQDKTKWKHFINQKLCAVEWNTFSEECFLIKKLCKYSFQTLIYVHRKCVCVLYIFY